MLTTTDFQKLIKLFVTKTEFEQGIEKLEEKMATKDDHRMVMITLDKVLKEVLAMRQEQTFHVQKHKDIDQKLKELSTISQA